MEFDARIDDIRQETPSVKSFVLDLEGAEMSFLPGQWIDVVIDAEYETIVGGFSLTSSPLRKDRIQLAVKKQPHGRASVYLHEQAKVGDRVLVLGPSGNFYYQPQMGRSLVLIAGGIGITPLMSMVRFVDEAELDIQATLLYSAGTPDEFVFFDELRAISARNSRIRCIFTATRPAGKPWEGRVGRIDAKLLADNIRDRAALFYVCGPAGMPEAITAMLVSLGIPASQIRTEGW